MKQMEKYSIDRFLSAQECVFEEALNEIKNERKTGHWMWFIFPQLRFLGKSEISFYYGITDENEAIEYCQNKVLYDRYIKCCKALLETKDEDIVRIMGNIDALKLRSSITLFYLVDESSSELYIKLIEKFYQGKFDDLTVQYIQKRRTI